jgi:prolyl oligopeptidase
MMIRSLCCRLLLAALGTLLPLHAMPQTPNDADDPFLWLEEVQGEKALAWVRERNAQSQQVLQATPGFDALQARLLQLLNSTDRIPRVSRQGDWLYNFWQDPAHKRGLWRRTTLAEYRKAKTAWETVLDLDALAATEGENWVWGGAHCLEPQDRRCLVSLSRGGADAKVIREFDTVTKSFVKDGFMLPEAKSDVEWLDADTLYVGTDFGPGSLTESGYPRITKRWKRGTPLAAAVTVFAGQAKDVWAGVSVDRTPGFERTMFVRALDFYNQERFVLQGEQLVRLDLPADARVSFMHSAGVREDTLLLELRSELKTATRTFPSGALLAADASNLLQGDATQRSYEVLFEPTATRSLAGFTTTRSHVIVNVLDNVASKLEEWRRTPKGFVRREIQAPFPGTLSVASLHDPMRRSDALAEQYTLLYTDFLTPDSLLLGRTGSDKRTPLKALSPAFDANGMRAEQFFAKSADGTRVPYFVVWPKGAQADGNNPTLLYGYGGFRNALEPWYSRAFGNAWYARGGVLVVANIRGGGEFGPAWHQAAVKANKQRSYDDFIAVAEDLIARKITRPRHLGIEGGSNGGLLVGAVFTQRPELFNAVVCQVPLLDMKRYHKLLAGASWMAEYGDPDVPEEWAFISKYSPYQNVKAGVTYPKVFFTTSTRDDRVHPGHARKMAARMLSQGHELLYYENTEGGHGLAADNQQRAHVQALEFSYLWQQLSPASSPPTPSPK